MLQFWAELVPEAGVEDYDFEVESLTAKWFADEEGTQSLGTTDVTSDAVSKVTIQYIDGIYIFSYTNAIDRGPAEAATCTVTIFLRDRLTGQTYSGTTYLFNLN